MCLESVRLSYLRDYRATGVIAIDEAVTSCVGRNGVENEELPVGVDEPTEKPLLPMIKPALSDGVDP